MQIGTNEGSFPVMAGIAWARTYHAVVATPVRVAELFSGLLAWAAARMLAAATLFASRGRDRRRVFLAARRADAARRRALRPRVRRADGGARRAASRTTTR